jgi:hypothetical protein
VRWVLAIAAAALLALAAWTLAVRHAVQTATPAPASKAETKVKAKAQEQRQQLEHEDDQERKAIDNATKQELIERARRRAVDGMRRD